MSSDQKGTGWIQKLSKQQITDELIKRNVEFDESENYNTLRELLRETIKKENLSAKLGKSSKEAPENANTEAVNSNLQELEDGNNSETNENSNQIMSEPKIEFKLNESDWELFEEKLEFFFITKKITDDKMKVATLVTQLNDKAHALLKSMVAPNKITAKAYADVIKLMSDQLAPKPPEAVERCNFHQAKQDPQESIAKYVARLRGPAVYCNFQYNWIT